MHDITSKFTSHLKHALTRAFCFVLETKTETIAPMHLLYSLTLQDGCIAAEILKKNSITPDTIRAHAHYAKPTSIIPTDVKTLPNLSMPSKEILERAIETAKQYKHTFIGTEHVLFALLHKAPKDLIHLFALHGLDVSVLHEELESVFETTSTFTELQDATNSSEGTPAGLESLQLDLLGSSTEEETDESKSPALDYFTDNLQDRVTESDFIPVIGRGREVKRLAHILARRQKNNPILIGEPGVGKTAIIEGLAKRIADKDVPESLLGKRILRLDLPGLIAGTMYRGEFESRLRALIDEVRQDKNIILFIDEVHTIMGAGSTSGSLDAANILKPALARSEIRCIGATTLAEYKKFIETDGALERRFQKLMISEPNEAETLEIMRGIAPIYEAHHGVRYTDASLQAAVKLSGQFLTHAHFPDKAIDLLDESGSAMQSSSSSYRKDASDMQEELALLKKQKKEAISADDLHKAASLKDRIKKLHRKIEDLKKDLPRVTEIMIRNTLSEFADIPADMISRQERAHLAGLEVRLKKSIIGQSSVVSRIARSIQKAKLGFSKPYRPRASFLFFGPPGCGKTHAAQALHKELFDRDESFLRLDMSEYVSQHSVSKLVGSPPGYIGYRERARLTDHVKEHPHSVLLFDEIEKAHGDVQNLLLQILDDGMLTDATGRRINFRHTIIVLTTNAGAELVLGDRFGFEDKKQTRNQPKKKDLHDWLRPELLSRISDLCLFEPLTKMDLARIAKRELAELKHRFSDQAIDLAISRSVYSFLSAHADPKQGARDLEIQIARHVEEPLMDLLLSAKSSSKKIDLQVKDNKIVIS
jgi:ATP-dependent Clp protease ATP-binding subunit ClpC